MNALRGVIATSFFAFARPAAAEGDRPFRLAYRAPDACPSVATLEARIEAGSARVRAARSGEVGFDVSVEINVTNAGFTAALRVRSPEGAEAARSVPASTCTEAVEAVALIAAIAIDPEAASPVTSSPPAESAPVSPAVIGGPAMRDHAEVAGPGDRRGAASNGVHGQLRAAASEGLIGAIAPSISPNLAAGVSYDLGTVGWRALLIGVSGEWANSFAVDTSEGRAQFERFAGRTFACPSAWQPNVRWTLRPCGFFDLGELRAGGSETTEPENVQSLWAAAGIAARADVDLLGRWAAIAEIGALFPFRRDRFYFAPNVVAHRTDAVGIIASIGFTFRIL